MKLYAGKIYWSRTKSSEMKFKKVDRNIDTDVLIVGAGMSGSLCAYVLSLSGIKVTVVERGKIGYGSSAANTGMLQYSNDKKLSDFVRDIGEEKAVLFYKMCLEAMDKLTEIVSNLEEETDYILRDSINYASVKKDRDILLKDFEYLSKYGFPAEFIDGEELKEKYAVDKAAALRTWHDAEVNPYKLIQALTKKNIEQGVVYYEKTEVDTDQITDEKAVTADGYNIDFTSIILTTGYTKIYPIIKDKCTTNRTYAFASYPMEEAPWKDKVMLWETRIPYLYFRSTADNRIIGGGLDEGINEVEYDENKIKEKTRKIAGEIEKIFPQLKIDIQYSWSALFYGSADGLPFIGRDPKNPNKYYLLGYEGNGTCYSVAGAYILKDLIKRKHNIYEEILRVDR